jgi:hypothetical protein
MPFGIPRSAEERRQRHKRLYGEETEPPAKRRARGPSMETPREILWAWLPDAPFANGRWNPPFPRWLNAKLFGAGRRL